MTEAWHDTFKIMQGDIVDMIDVAHKNVKKEAQPYKKNTAVRSHYSLHDEHKLSVCLVGPTMFI